MMIILLVDEPLKVGDVVELKSGGPRMTVNHIQFDENDEPVEAECAWFTGVFSLDAKSSYGSVSKEVFGVAALRVVEAAN